MRNESCACGSGEVELWNRKIYNKGKGGRTTWFAHCWTCGKMTTGNLRREAAFKLKNKESEDERGKGGGEAAVLDVRKAVGQGVPERQTGILLEGLPGRLDRASVFQG